MTSYKDYQEKEYIITGVDIKKRFVPRKKYDDLKQKYKEMKKLCEEYKQILQQTQSPAQPRTQPRILPSFVTESLCRPISPPPSKYKMTGNVRSTKRHSCGTKVAEVAEECNIRPANVAKRNIRPANVAKRNKNEDEYMSIDPSIHLSPHLSFPDSQETVKAPSLDDE